MCNLGSSRRKVGNFLTLSTEAFIVSSLILALCHGLHIDKQTAIMQHSVHQRPSAAFATGKQVLPQQSHHFPARPTAPSRAARTVTAAASTTPRVRGRNAIE